MVLYLLVYQYERFCIFYDAYPIRETAWCAILSCCPMRENAHEGYKMEPSTFRDITREYYRKGVGIMDLEVYMREHKITYHTNVRPLLYNRHEETAEIRILDGQMFSGLAFTIGENTAHKRLVTPSAIDLHSLDENCVIIPNLKHYVGAYRYVPYDDTPTITSRRMGYFRCPNIITAVSLSLWLRHPRIVEAIRHEFKQKKRLKEMNAEFLYRIPVPDGMLQPHLVSRAVEIDSKILASHHELVKLVGELSDMSVEYA